jgi:long-chain fatty acid transport protein
MAVTSLVAAGLYAFSAAALATNGYFTHGVGTESKAMAGAGVASVENLGGVASATNPALAVFSDDNWQVGLSIFSPRRSYTADAGLQGQCIEAFQQCAFSLSAGTYDSKNEAFPIPYVAKNWKLSEDSALSFVFYGRGGMNTEWDNGQSAFFDPLPFNPNSPGTVNPPGLYGGGKAGVDLMQAFMSISYAAKIGDNFAWGIGPVVAAQLFEATGVANFAPYTQTFANAFPGYFGACLQGGGDAALCQAVATQQGIQDVTSLTNNGHDSSIGYGVAAGIWTGTEAFSFGLSYQSKMSMDDFSKYSDLYAQSGGFDIPSTLKAGVSFQAGATARVNFDVEHIGYTDVDSVSNPIANLLTGCYTANPQVAPASDGCLGGPNGAGFGWEDMTVYKIGAAIQADDRTTWRFGYSYGEQPIPESEVLFNILAPGVMEQHFTVGWARERSNGGMLSFALMYAPKKTVSGFSTFDPRQTIQVEMSQIDFEVGYRF